MPRTSWLTKLLPPRKSLKIWISKLKRRNSSRMSTSSKLMRLSKQLSMLRPGDGYQSKWVILWKNMYITLKMGTSTLCLEYRDLKAFQRLLERRANLLSFTNTVCLIALLASFAMRRSLWDSSW